VCVVYCGIGAAYLYNDLTVYNSDRTTLYYCRRCGQAANSPPGWDPLAPNICCNDLCQSNAVVPIVSTWCFHLLSTELRALNINMTLTIGKNLAAANDRNGPLADDMDLLGGGGDDGGDGGDDGDDDLYSEDSEEQDKDLQLQLRIMEGSDLP
jgi:hypothetical protein